jgi:DNA replication licensing factor MCM4
VSVRTNPRRRAIKSLFKTYVDVVHIKRTSKARVGIDSSIVNHNEYIVEVDEGDTVKNAVVENEEELIELSKRPDIYELLSRSIGSKYFNFSAVYFWNGRC